MLADMYMMFKHNASLSSFDPSGNLSVVCGVCLLHQHNCDAELNKLFVFTS